MRILNHIITLRASALWPWSHFRVHRREYYTHVVWGRLSLEYGQPHLEPVRVCSDCGDAISTKSAGDESWDWCEGCQQVEGRTHEVTMEEYEGSDI